MSTEDRERLIGVKNEQRIIALENAMLKVETAIIEMRDKLLGRPTWFIAFLLTAMMSVIVSLLIVALQGS